ncbi:MAG TPA: hypothetical protein VK655_01610 [Solirubrobacteraceae bacterium]|nr:hypothetical protein [Solirubrobacteraceae bacterium]
MLNEQREANGIPGGLVEVPELSQGCAEYLDNYELEPGQYPHEEIPTQPGYSPLGNEAASMSDLVLGRSSEGTDSGPLIGVQWWTIRFNPWSDAPLHLAALFDPAAAATWFAESGTGACMGTFPFERHFAAPAFYSYPGPGTTNVPMAQRADELPWTPQEAAGLPSTQVTGPNFLLFPEGVNEPKLLGVELATAAGASVPVAVANPESMEPEPTDPSFPKGYTVGDYSRGAAFAIPPAPLNADTSYVLTAKWEEKTTSSSFTQRVDFTTGSETLEEMMPGLPLLEFPSSFQSIETSQGEVPIVEPRVQPIHIVTRALSVRLRLRNNAAVLTVPATAIGQTALITVKAQRQVCAHRYSRCEWHTVKILRRDDKLRSLRTTVPLPHDPGDRFHVSVTLPPFTSGATSYRVARVEGVTG